MKIATRLSLNGLISLLFAHSALAVTPVEGAYIGLMGGLSFLPSISLPVHNPNYILIQYSNYNPNITRSNFRTQHFISLPFSPGFGLPNIPGFPGLFILGPLINGTFTHRTGFDLGAQLGYRICNFRFEAQLLGDYASIGSLKVAGTTISTHVTPVNPLRVSGHTAFGAGLVNAFYDFYDEDNDPTWVPYLGLGIGYAHVLTSASLSVPYFYRPEVNINYKASGNSPIGQLIFGISYYTSDTVAINLDYRYLTTRNVQNVGRFSASTINLGFNYWFCDD